MVRYFFNTAQEWTTFSHFFEGKPDFASTLKDIRRICNFFYPERAKERASFLNRSIKAGRMARRNELRKNNFSRRIPMIRI